jgi:hypothetical protein
MNPIIKRLLALGYKVKAVPMQYGCQYVIISKG